MLGKKGGGGLAYSRHPFRWLLDPNTKGWGLVVGMLHWMSHFKCYFSRTEIFHSNFNSTVGPQPPSTTAQHIVLRSRNQ